MSESDINTVGLPPGVNVTKSYGIFKKVLGNRATQEPNVRRIIKSMEKHGNLLVTNPIIVNEKMEVIDGQHRLEAAKRLKYDVAYVIREGETISSVVGLNSAATPWKLQEYAESYADRNYEEYQRLMQLCKTYDVPFGLVANLAGTSKFGNNASKNHEGLNSGGEVRENTRASFQAGEFVFKNYETVVQLLKQYAELKQIVKPMGASYDRALFYVMQNVNYDHQRMLDKYGRYGTFIKPQRTKKDFINEIEDIYNYNSRDRVRF